MHYFSEEVLLGCLSLTDDGLDSRVGTRNTHVWWTDCCFETFTKKTDQWVNLVCLLLQQLTWTRPKNQDQSPMRFIYLDTLKKKDCLL